MGYKKSRRFPAGILYLRSAPFLLYIFLLISKEGLAYLELIAVIEDLVLIHGGGGLPAKPILGYDLGYKIAKPPLR